MQQISEAQASQVPDILRSLRIRKLQRTFGLGAEASKAAEESETAQKAEQDQAAKVLEEQTKAANRECRNY